MSERRALITGITGQDGSYLRELLLEKGYEVGGLVHADDPASAHVSPDITRLHGDLRNEESLEEALRSFRPQEVYNLAAQSSVAASFGDPVSTIDVTGLGVVRLLNAIRKVDTSVRFFQASSSEIFGDTSGAQNEQSAIAPTSPYGVAKALGHHIVRTYRDAHSMFACTGILFNHESPRRGANFVTRKITTAAARISLGLEKSVALGNLDVWRDWGFAGDYVRAMHLAITHDVPDDFVIATGVTHSLQEFLELAFGHVNLDWHDHVVSDPSLFRPSEITQMRGDPSHARRTLGWGPAVDFATLVTMMVDADLELNRKSTAKQTSAMGPAASV